MHKTHYSLHCSLSLPRSHSPWATQQGPVPPDLEATALSSIFPSTRLPCTEIPLMTSFHFLSQPHPKTPFSASREASW